MKVQFRNTNTGRMITLSGLTEEQTKAAVAFARTMGEPEVVELRVRVHGTDGHGNAEWADVTNQF